MSSVKSLLAIVAVDPYHLPSTLDGKSRDAFVTTVRHVDKDLREPQRVTGTDGIVLDIHIRAAPPGQPQRVAFNIAPRERVVVTEVVIKQAALLIAILARAT